MQMIDLQPTNSLSLRTGGSHAPYAFIDCSSDSHRSRTHVSETASGNSGHSERARSADAGRESTTHLCDVIADRALSIHRRSVRAHAAAGWIAHQASHPRTASRGQHDRYHAGEALRWRKDSCVTRSQRPRKQLALDG